MVLFVDRFLQRRHNIVTCYVEGWIEIPIARQRIRITYPRIQLAWQTEQWGYCCSLVTVCKHACIMATDRPTIDNNGPPRLYKELKCWLLKQSAVGDEVCDGSLKKQSGIWTHQEQFVKEVLSSGLRQLGADEEPEEAAGSCDVIGSVISDCNSAWCNIQ
jgi:hypothetical protein